MTHLMKPTAPSAISDELEGYIRRALLLGQLSPTTLTRIQSLITQHSLSDQDRRRLAILQDAIRDGCIQLVAPSTTQS
ncbi:MAG: hypothetical protein VKK04_01680 [Synechococcales bacterium]|nr:hypothetical protein [Synechococcales bacterium]